MDVIATVDLAEAYQQPQQQLNKLQAFLVLAETLVAELVAELNWRCRRCCCCVVCRFPRSCSPSHAP